MNNIGNFNNIKSLFTGDELKVADQDYNRGNWFNNPAPPIQDEYFMFQNNQFLDGMIDIFTDIFTDILDNNDSNNQIAYTQEEIIQKFQPTKVRSSPK